uniref:Ovule protein n=1 Tax=Heterorhabditis bacteriophora TaxID=37862 RepID=A0A1I7W8Z5_HETBA
MKKIILNIYQMSNILVKFEHMTSYPRCFLAGVSLHVVVCRNLFLAKSLFFKCGYPHSLFSSILFYTKERGCTADSHVCSLSESRQLSPSKECSLSLGLACLF